MINQINSKFKFVAIKLTKFALVLPCAQQSREHDVELLWPPGDVIGKKKKITYHF